LNELYWRVLKLWIRYWSYCNYRRVNVSAVQNSAFRPCVFRMLCVSISCNMRLIKAFPKRASFRAYIVYGFTYIAICLLCVFYPQKRLKFVCFRQNVCTPCFWVSYLWKVTKKEKFRRISYYVVNFYGFLKDIKYVTCHLQRLKILWCCDFNIIYLRLKINTGIRLAKYSRRR
jgi:hypothetical protein